MADEGVLRHRPLQAALARCRGHFVTAALFSAISNILYLTPSLYMMQVYDRVVPTGGLATLAAISVIGLAGLATLSLLEWLRARLLVRAGARLERELAPEVLGTVLNRPELSRLARSQAMQQFETLKQAISSPSAIAIFDAPWTPIYILVAWLLHPALGLLALGGGIVLLLLAWSNERATSAMIRESGSAAAAVQSRQLHAAAHAAEVRAMGLGTALVTRQAAERAEVAGRQLRASFAGHTHQSLIKFVRLTLQSASLGLGALLVVDGGMSGGAMLASSLLIARALAPIELVVGAWKSLLAARTAYAALDTVFDRPPERQHTRLPAPTGAMAAERLTVLTPQDERIAIADVTFAVAAGECVGVIGHSGAGKSSLLRALAGSVLPTRGTVRFDGASSLDWDHERLARHMGYLPQSFVLFPGSVKENIARFRGGAGEDAEALDAAVVAAASAIGAHELILRLPEGYDTMIGTGGIGLSAGQTQRIAIARALFGGPRILILDEPTAHLDDEAQAAFARSLSALRVAGATVLFATHSRDLLASADRLLLLKEGRLERYASLAEAMPTLRPPVSHDPAKAMR